MRRSSLIMVSLLLFLCACVTDDGSVYKKYFTRYFGNDGDHEAADMVINADGTIVLIGTSEFPANSGNTKIYVAKADKDGHILWEKTIGTGVDFAQDIEATSNGYIILSNIATGGGQYDFKLTRIDPNGNEGVSFVFDMLADQFGYSVTPLSDGGFYVAGNTSDTDINLNTALPTGVDDFKDLLYVRLDENLQVTIPPYDRVGGSTDGSAIKVFETSPGEFTAVEYSDILTGGESDYELNFGFINFSIGPTSPSDLALYIGDIIKDEVMNQAVYGADGSLYSIGTSINVTGGSSIFITKIRSTSGDPFQQFASTFSSGVQGVSIFNSGLSCYVLGNAISESDGTRDIWLTRVNSITGEQDSKWINGLTFGTATNDDTGKVVMTGPDGNIVILGTVNLTNQRKITLIKLSPDGKFVP